MVLYEWTVIPDGPLPQRPCPSAVLLSFLRWILRAPTRGGRNPCDLVTGYLGRCVDVASGRICRRGFHCWHGISWWRRVSGFGPVRHRRQLLRDYRVGFA